MASEPGEDFMTRAGDRLAIHDCLYRNCVGTDMLEADIWKATYWPEAEEEHGWYYGNAHQFVDQMIPILRSAQDMTWHNMGNIMIEFEGDRARSVSYYYVYVRKIKPDSTRADTFSGGRYIDWFEKRAGIWKLRYRILDGDWTRNEKDSVEWGKEVYPGYTPKFGTRHPDDPARAMFGGASPSKTAAAKPISPPW